MVYFFLTLAGICALYFVVVAAYSGITASFGWAWLVLAAGFFLMAVLLKRARANRGGMPSPLLVFVGTSVCLGGLLVLLLSAAILRAAAEKPENGAEYVIVPGARVYPDGISRTLKLRLDTAWEYHRKNPEAMLVLSGGQGKDEAVPEALAMYNYLYVRGIAQDRMLPEMESANTVQNIRFSKDVIARNSVRPPQEMKVALVTSSFHMLRVKNIARKQGFEHLIAVPAPSDPLLIPHNLLRECAAVIKDVLTGNMQFDVQIRKTEP